MFSLGFVIGKRVASCSGLSTARTYSLNKPRHQLLKTADIATFLKGCQQATMLRQRLDGHRAMAPFGTLVNGIPIQKIFRSPLARIGPSGVSWCGRAEMGAPCLL